MRGYLRVGATFSPDRLYRYDLWRIWREDGRRINFVGLNPSTANENSDDPTIRRCVGFAIKWGYGEMHMLNLFAFVSTDPLMLYKCNNEEPIGEENDEYLKALYPEIVACWGNHGKINGRSEQVRRLLKEPYAFGINKNGEPKHPLYLPLTAKLERYQPELERM